MAVLPLAAAWPLAWARGQAQTSSPAPLLHLERSSGVDGPWQPVTAQELTPSGDGGWLDAPADAAAFYRLRIDLRDPQGAPVAVPLGALPPASLEVAIEHLESLRSEEPDWAAAQLAPVATPIYNPVIGDGRSPAWYEIKLVAGSSTVPGGPQNDPTRGGLGNPSEGPATRGYMLVSATQEDVPVPEYATRGESPVDRLRRQAGTGLVRLVRYSEAFWAAENAKGDAVATYGTTPFRYDRSLLDLAGRAFEAELDSDGTLREDSSPDVAATAFGSYADFRDAYLNDPVYRQIHAWRAADGALEWGIWQDRFPEEVQVPLREATILFRGEPLTMAEVDDDEFAELTVLREGGLEVTGLATGTTILRLMGPDGGLRFYTLVVGDPAEQVGTTGWGPWTTYYGGSCATMPHYSQEWDLAGACNDAWSGCGPTAWAMFYGYWDSRGAPNLIAGTAPTSNNDAVRQVIVGVFDLVDTWCTKVNDQAATHPYKMHRGHQWAGLRGESIWFSSSWSLPYGSKKPRRRARDAIRDHGRPAIVGIGYLSHYPIAYGYRWKQKKWGKLVLKTRRNWKVYMGWGGDDCRWVNANNCWFGINAYCW